MGRWLLGLRVWSFGVEGRGRGGGGSKCQPPSTRGEVRCGRLLGVGQYYRFRVSGSICDFQDSVQDFGGCDLSGDRSRKLLPYPPLAAEEVASAPQRVACLRLTFRTFRLDAIPS